jgi:hypothetical protein
MHHLNPIQINVQAQLLPNQVARNAVTIAFEMHQAITVYSGLYNPIVGIRGAMSFTQETSLFLLKDLGHGLLLVLWVFALRHIVDTLYG